MRIGIPQATRLRYIEIEPARDKHVRARYCFMREKDWKKIDALPIGRERTEEEKKRRHLHGDKGASFSKGKKMCLLKDGVSGCITTFVTKDNLVCEIYEEDN